METTSADASAADQDHDRSGPARSKAGWLILIGTVLAGAVVGVLAARLIPDPALPRSVGRGVKLLAIAAIPVSLFLAILTHELGHVAGGLLAGFRFLLLIVGPIKLTSGATGLRLSLNRSLALAGGLAACLPVDLHNLRRRQLLMIAGGPLASFLLAIAGGIGCFLLRGFAPWDFLAAVTGFVSLSIGFATLIPMRTVGLLTDGAQLLSLIRDDGVASARAHYISLMSASISGIRPRDWDPELVTSCVAASKDEPNLAASAKLFAYYAALDHDDFAAAQQDLLESQSLGIRSSQLIQASVGLEQAYLAATQRGDAEAAKRYRNVGNDTLIESHTKLRVDAAIALAEGRKDVAKQLAQQAIERSREATDVGGAIAERDWIARDILAKLEVV